MNLPKVACRIGLHRWGRGACGVRKCMALGCTATMGDPEPELEPEPEPGMDLWITVTRWNGTVAYSGPAPVPLEADCISLNDLRLGRFNTYEVVPVELDEATSDG